MTSDSFATNSGANAEPSNTQPSISWQPLTRHQRRVLGVLIEKSKTTPDVYPMSVNGIKNGCNQKSNRSPQMELQEEQVENVLIELRKIGCVIEVHAGGRIPKYKHQAYDWLAVQKAELGVLAELLLRGEQTVGELRARVARMEQEIHGLDDLVPVLNTLREKNLILELTPPGRGQIVTHNLYPPTEKEQLLERFKDSLQPMSIDQDAELPLSSGSSVSHRSHAVTESEMAASDFNWRERIENLESQVEELQRQMSELKRLIES